MTAVKIDRSFIERLGAADDSSAVVKAIVEMGHATGLDVVAEGVSDVRRRRASRRWAATPPRASSGRGRCRSTSSRLVERGERLIDEGEKNVTTARRLPAAPAGAARMLAPRSTARTGT